LERSSIKDLDIIQRKYAPQSSKRPIYILSTICIVRENMIETIVPPHEKADHSFSKYNSLFLTVIVTESIPRCLHTLIS